MTSHQDSGEQTVDVAQRPDMAAHSSPGLIRSAAMDGKNAMQSGLGAGFDLQRHYRELSQPEHLQLFRDEVSWLQRYTKPDRAAEVVLSFGCAIQTVPHIMLTQAAVFKALGIDFVATAGQAYCCGAPFQRDSKAETGRRVAYTSIRRFAEWQPRVNVQQCGQCYMQFSSHVANQAAETGHQPFEVVHLTSFLLDTLRRQGGDVPWQQPTRRRRVLLHAEGAELHVTKQEAREAIIDTLELIPGVEYAGLVEDPSVGSPCGTGESEGPLRPSPYGTKVARQDDITSAEYRQAQAEIEAQAAAVGADAIVTPHHKCHREWSKLGSERLPILHYTSVLAEALGISIPDRFQILWRLGDPEKILDMTRPYWQSWDITEPEAREMVDRYFVPTYADAAEECPCGSSRRACFEAVVAPGVAERLSA